jgi:hypothetical protein
MYRKVTIINLFREFRAMDPAELTRCIQVIQSFGCKIYLFLAMHCSADQAKKPTILVRK